MARTEISGREERRDGRRKGGWEGREGQCGRLVWVGGCVGVFLQHAIVQSSDTAWAATKVVVFLLLFFFFFFFFFFSFCYQTSSLHAL